MTKKRRQHYVWRHYLRAWSDNNDHLYCSRAGKVFKSNLVNVAQERDFYRLEELSTREISFIEKVFLESFPEHLQEINRDWIKIFNQVFQMRKQLEERGILDEEWEKFLDLTVNNFEEEVHAKVESDSTKFLGSIKSEGVSFFDNDADYMDFLLFSCIQYFRTQKIKFDVLAGLGERFTDIDFEAVWGVLKYMFATNLSYELFIRKDTTQLILLKNETSRELITGD